MLYMEHLRYDFSDFCAGAPSFLRKICPVDPESTGGWVPRYTQSQRSRLGIISMMSHDIKCHARNPGLVLDLFVGPTSGVFPGSVRGNWVLDLADYYYYFFFLGGGC
jgi:hypothetical protein